MSARSSASRCTVADLRAFTNEVLLADADAALRFSKSRVYLPLTRSEHAWLLSCAAAWFDDWLCALDPAPRDMGDMTVGKTLKERVIRGFIGTLDADGACRPTFASDALQRWAWRPPSTVNCRNATDWMRVDVCAAKKDDSGAHERLRVQGEALMRAAVLNSSLAGGGRDSARRGVLWSGRTTSAASLWWAGRLVVSSLASAGACTRRLASAMPLSSTPRPQSAVAMHMRRGDACMRWATQQGDGGLRGGRPCYNTSMYADAAKRMRDTYGFDQVLLATDSAAAAAELVDALQGSRMSVVQIIYNRSLVGGSSAINMGKRVDHGTVYIEDRLKANDTHLDRSLAISSLFAELDLLSGARAFIGTSTSWVSRLTYFAMAGRQGAPPPFIFLDAPLGALFPGRGTPPPVCSTAEGPSGLVPSASSFSALVASRHWKKASSAGEEGADRAVAVTMCARELGHLIRSRNSSRSTFTHRAHLLKKLDDARLLEVCSATASQETFDRHTRLPGCWASLVAPAPGVFPAGSRLCVLGLNFGCTSSPYPPMLWTDMGCQGRFLCNGVEIACGNITTRERHACVCEAERHPTTAHELKLTDAFDEAQWRNEVATVANNPASHTQHLPASLQTVRPVSCERVLGIPHGYGAFLFSAVSMAWDLERRGKAPLLMLPPWLEDVSRCNFTAARSPHQTIDNPSSHATHRSLAAARHHRLSELLDPTRHACASRWLTCLTEPRRGCSRPGRSSWSTRGLWSDRLASRRPSVPLPGAPFLRVAEYAADLLRPNEAFIETLLAPFLQQLEPLRPALAVHLRYGDSCGTFEANRTKRRCGPVDEYVDAAAQLHGRFAYRSVVLASDSHEAEAKFRRLWNGRTRIFSTGASDDVGGDALERRGINFERHVQLLQGKRKQQQCDEWKRFADFLVDVHALAACDSLIGKFTSNLDRLVLALMAARIGRTPPYISMDGSKWCNNAQSTWGASHFGAFPCRIRSMDDPPDEDDTLLHVLGPEGRIQIAEPRRRPTGYE